MRQANLDELDLGVRMGGRKINKLRYADDTTLLAESNCTLTELCGLTRDRDAWRKMVMGITRSRTRLDGTR